METASFMVGYCAGAVYRSIVDTLLGILEWVTRPIEEGMNP